MVLRSSHALARPTQSTRMRRAAELEVIAHRVSPAILTLTDDGMIGVKTLGPDNRVRFHPIQIIGDGADGVWLSGLPNRITLITVGQEFVAEGQTVRPIDEADLPPASGSGS